MHIPRFLKKELKSKFQPNKVVVLYGPRQVGKTTLMKEILDESKEKYLLLSGENSDVQSWLGSQSLEVLRSHIGSHTMIAIDEAQNIPNIGVNLKLLVDSLPGIRIFATGSASFMLANQVGEPLVGRKWQFTLFPIAQLELSPIEEIHETTARIEERLLFGSYPAVLTTANRDGKVELLRATVDSALYKDLLMFEDIRKSEKIIQLLKLIALQIGKEVSNLELAKALSMNVRTVEKYLMLLEQVYVLIRVGGFSRNLRKEISKSSRWYFYDVGIRNAILNNFVALENREDVGALWENYLFVERYKKQEYYKMYANNYFWRTYDQQVIDLIEEKEGKLFGYEFKWGKKIQKAPKIWLTSYKNASYEVINRENYLGFIA